MRTCQIYTINLKFKMSNPYTHLRNKVDYPIKGLSVRVQMFRQMFPYVIQWVDARNKSGRLLAGFCLKLPCVADPVDLINFPVTSTRFK